MKTLKALIILSLLIVANSCSNDDDNNDNVPPQSTNQELLISGKWYQESNSGTAFTQCEKNSSWDFIDITNLAVETFDDSSGTCESLGITNATYTLTNDVNLELSAPGTTIIATIQSITSSELVLLGNGDTVVFDKTPG
jgi:hypothetical protein